MSIDIDQIANLHCGLMENHFSSLAPATKNWDGLKQIRLIFLRCILYFLLLHS